jgi:glycosyltransferase involved in cell wall biosynthesis
VNDKTICILSHTPIANDSRVLKIIRYFADKGFYCQVIYPVSNKKNALPKSILNNVDYTPVLIRNSFFRQVLRHTLFPFEFNYITEYINQKVLLSYIYINDLPCLNAGIILKRRNPGSALIYDSHEIYCETVNQFFPLNINLLKSIVFKGLITIMKTSGFYIERKLVKKVDLFITVNESIKNYFEKRYGISGVQVMMNCPSAKQSQKDMTIVDYRKTYGWNENSRVFLYQGAWNKGRGLELLIRVFQEAPREFKLVIIGWGVLEKEMKNIIDENDLQEKVKLYGFVPQENLLSFTKAADVGLNLLEPFNLSKAMASPNKLFEYIHAGIPVICSDTFENRRVLEKYDVGILTENSLESLLNCIRHFADHLKIDEKKKDIPKARELYSWEKQTIVLDEFLFE